MESIHGTVHESIYGDIMKKEKEYSEYIKECWAFAQRVVREIAHKENRDQPSNLEYTIFDKCCSPHYYFVQNEQQGPIPQPPSNKQIAYAKDLGIENPDKFSSRELSKKIDERKKLKWKNEEEA